jgi:hypothetical protein
MALVKGTRRMYGSINPRKVVWKPVEDPGSDYRPPASVAHRMMAKGLLEEVLDDEGLYTGRYRLTDLGFRKARGTVHAV